MTAASAPAGRAQANLPALAVALLLLATTVGLGLALADGAFADATRQPGERRVAVSLSERLVAADGPLTLRGNVLNGTALGDLDADRLREAFPVTHGYDVRVRLDGRTLVSAGDPTGGATVRRVVLVATREPATVPVEFAGPNASVTLPRRSDRATVTIEPDGAASVATVRANDRVVLHNASGLVGSFELRFSRLETTRLSFEASGPLPDGSATVSYAPAETTKGELVVTVDA